MFVTYPGYLDAELMRDFSLTLPHILEVEMLTSESTKLWLHQNDVQIICYVNLAA